MNNYMNCEKCGDKVECSLSDMDSFIGVPCEVCGEVMTTQEQNEKIRYVKDNSEKFLQDILKGDEKYTVTLSSNLLVGLITNPSILASHEILKDLSSHFNIKVRGEDNE